VPSGAQTAERDGRTHLAHKAEHAVDLDTGAIVAVTLRDADEGDTTTLVETAIAAAEQIEAAQVAVDDPQPLEEIVADKGYHSNQIMRDLVEVGIRAWWRLTRCVRTGLRRDQVSTSPRWPFSECSPIDQPA
jgi:transposase